MHLCRQIYRYLQGILSLQARSNFRLECRLRRQLVHSRGRRGLPTIGPRFCLRRDTEQFLRQRGGNADVDQRDRMSGKRRESGGVPT